MILSNSPGSWIHVNYSEQNNYNKKMQYKTVDYYILQQHKDHNYFIHSNSLVNYYILEIEKCKNILVPDVINTLCHTYYFEYENCVFYLAYHIWKHLKDLNTTHSVWITTYTNEEMECFTGNKLLSHAKKTCRKNYYKQEVTTMIDSLSYDLIEYGYIELSLLMVY